MNANAPAHAGLAAFEDHAEFAARHIGTTPADQAAMLAVLGYPSRAALIDAIVPAGIRERAPLPLPGPVAESEALARLKSIAAENRVLTSYIGQGYYGTHTPGVILRNILENPAWYTAYTPYQPEISQGRLEALVNFQTMVCDLTGMAIANASMLDEATAAAEAMALALRVGRSASRRFFVADDVFAQTLDVVRTRAAPLGIDGRRRSRAGRAARRRVRRAAAVSGRERRRARRPRARGRAARAGRAGHRRRRHPRADAAGAAGRMGRGCRRRLHAALRRADGLRRSARGLPRDARRVQALDAGTARRRDRRRAGQSGVPAGAADARAAHPPREGDVEHLHGAGAAGRHREHVRGLPRPGGTRADRAARAPAHRDPEGRTRQARLHGADRRVLRHDRRGHRRAHAANPRRRRRARRQLPANRRRDDRHLARRDDDARGRRAHLRRVPRRHRAGDGGGARRGGDRRAAARASADVAVPHPSGVPPPSLRNGDAALPAPARRPRPGARPGDDPARIVHDEAQRDVAR